MRGIVDVPLVEGGSILVEVDEVTGDAVVRGRGATVGPAQLAEPLEHVLAGLGPATRALVSQLRALTDSPHEIEVEFGVKLSADAKIIIARAGGEANFRIVLRWARTPDPPSSSGAER